MARQLNLQKLANEWARLSKHWHAIYRWGMIANQGYSDQIADLIHRVFDEVQLLTKDLRYEHFRVLNHHGQANLQTDISQLTKQRFCRAIFNAMNTEEIEPLGRILDYEVPLETKYGEIDLLSRRGDEVFILEAKHPSSAVSVLKGILQAFVNASLVSIVRKPFLNCFQLPLDVQLVPAVLTFECAVSGRQLRGITDSPHLMRLLARIDASLAAKDLSPMRFFVVSGTEDHFCGCLIQPIENGPILFRAGSIPEIVEVIVPRG